MCAATAKRDEMSEYFGLHVFLFLYSELFRLDSTFWLDSTLKLYYASPSSVDNELSDECVVDVLVVVEPTVQTK